MAEYKDLKKADLLDLLINRDEALVEIRIALKEETGKLAELKAELETITEEKDDLIFELVQVKKSLSEAAGEEVEDEPVPTITMYFPSTGPYPEYDHPKAFGYVCSVNKEDDLVAEVPEDRAKAERSREGRRLLTAEEYEEYLEITNVVEEDVVEE